MLVKLIWSEIEFSGLFLVCVMQENREEPADLHVGIDVHTGGFDA